MSFKLLMLLMLAGAVGTLCRYLGVRLFAESFDSGFPAGTLVINITGAFAAGLFFVLLKHKLPALEPFLPVLLVGFLGAFTTFSTFALESANMLMEGHCLKALLNIGLQNVAGLSAAVLGLLLGRCLC